jgi:hypothetical protein
MGFHKKRTRTRYAELVFLHAVGFVSHVVHSGASVEWNGNTLFFVLGWGRYEFDKNALGHITTNLCFCIQWDLQVT